jgi:hypothetical protein
MFGAGSLRGHQAGLQDCHLAVGEDLSSRQLTGKPGFFRLEEIVICLASVMNVKKRE